MESVNFEVAALLYKQVMEKKTEEEKMMVLCTYLSGLINKHSALTIGFKNMLDIFKKLDDQQHE